LRINCNENNIPHDIRELPSRGEYRLNCLAKPKFILDVLEEKKKPFIWLDVDSKIHAELSVFDDLDDKCDMAFAYEGFPPNVNPVQPKASPIYVTYKPIVIEFLNFWISKCEENIKTSDRKVFDHEILMFEVLPHYIQKLRMGMLNKSYALWPTHKVPENLKPMITMGIADGESKEKSLREMGAPEHIVQFNLVGNV
jgi:hypothetical protein